ncbi:hypothetical protein GCK72_022588 [Caenorhabditis remanei]|uniref:Uncharacterized protein n=1 Tax=Caenorhabditis remanei TaxID=31234 RepID=A0A6A5FUF1_CAERE|nr:hypothetical protein GCK72_022588 [Caenorhabditis remanei]KAF1746135.1 hypothetical protein GCK72_022588 [Caenorhabditis remanei]
MSCRTAPKNITCWILSAALVFIYFIVIGYVRYFDGYWLYPILTLFAIEHFVISYILAFFGFFLLTKSACLLNNFFHNSSTTPTVVRTKKTKKQH